MNESLDNFIDAVYREPYSLITNNCIHKSLRIRRRARELGKRADIVVCFSVVPVKKLHDFPTINPHVYTIVEGKRVDVSLDPGHERRYCTNAEKGILFPVNISSLRRRLKRSDRN